MFATVITRTVARLNKGEVKHADTGLIFVVCNYVESDALLWNYEYNYWKSNV
jgi:hypothetical protein